MLKFETSADRDTVLVFIILSNRNQTDGCQMGEGLWDWVEKVKG